MRCVVCADSVCGVWCNAAEASGIGMCGGEGGGFGVRHVCASVCLCGCGSEGGDLWVRMGVGVWTFLQKLPRGKIAQDKIGFHEIR